MAETWTIKRVLEWTEGYLGRRGEERPRLSAEWLLSAVTGLSRVELYVNYDRPLDPGELARMHGLVARRATGEPLQYVTGEMPFRHIVLRCEEGVLIPRPETELLVEAALEGVDEAQRRHEAEEAEPAGGRAAGPDASDEVKAEASSDVEPGANSDGAGDVDGGVKVPDEVDEGSDADAAASKEPPAPTALVLEVGTGTGCIACSIASERPGARVVATDVSSQAIALATRNRDALGLEAGVDLVECDLASGVDEGLMGTFDVLVSNPPYIPSAVVPTLPREVEGFEPHLALDGGPDGNDVFRRLMDLAPRALRPGGLFCVELFEEGVAPAAQLLRDQGGWERVEEREDYTHRPRFVVAWREA